MTDLRVIEFPSGNVQDIPARLRSLADLIEGGAIEGSVLGLTDATHLAWVTANEAGDVEVGMFGGSFDRYALAGLLSAGVTKATA